MSEQRRSRQELRQGLHQFVMTMYQSYLETHGEKEAKEFVTEAIKEQLDLFMASDPSHDNVIEVIKKIMNDLTQALDKTQDYDSQMRLSEKIDALQTTLEVLEQLYK